MDFPEFHRAVKRHLKAAGKLHRRGGGSDAATEQRRRDYATNLEAARQLAARDGKDWTALRTADRMTYMRQTGALQQAPAEYADKSAYPPVGVPRTLADGSTVTANADGTVTYGASPEEIAQDDRRTAAFQAQANQWAQDRVDEGRRLQQENESGFRKFARGAVGAATQVADFAVSVPGFNETMGSVYKHFAPPGSKYYQPGTLGEKTMGFAADTAADAVKGLVGGARKGRLRARGGADAPPPQPYWMNPAFIAAQQAAQQQQAAQAAAAIAAFRARQMPVAGDLVPEADWRAARAVTPRKRNRAAGG
jgi:hypothetical protein